MKKIELARAIENHHLYTGEYNSKNYYKYSSEKEINKLMKMCKSELVALYEYVYDANGRERTAHELG